MIHLQILRSSNLQIKSTVQKSLTYIYIFLFLLLFQSAKATDSTDIVYANAVQFQTDSNYQEAIMLYESIVDGETVSSALYNNLGLAYVGNNQLGLAIVHFERALQVNSNNEDAQHNLKAAEQRIEENYAAGQQLFFIRWWYHVVHILSSTGWAVFFLFLISLGVAGIAATRITKNARFKIAGIFILIFSILPLTWGFQQKTIESSDSQAIIIKPRVGLRQAPDLASEEIELVFEGLKVTIIKMEYSWVQVQLSNNLIGWMPAQMLEII
jgi:tetratricopeptide (TPR) repeat protein